jgi:hypothetical protein
LTISNVLVLAALAAVAIPVYVVYKALGDDKLLDRLMSTYEELDGGTTGCAVRHLQERGGPELWGVSSGFAFQGSDRWFVNVVLQRPPTAEEIGVYCDALKLIADRMLERGSKIYSGSVSGAEADGSGHDGPLPAGPEEETTEE